MKNSATYFSDIRSAQNKKTSSNFFIYVPGEWWARVSVCGGNAMRVAMILLYMYRLWGQPEEFKFDNQFLRKFGCSRFQKAKGLNALEKAGLVKVKRFESSNPRVKLLKL